MSQVKCRGAEGEGGTESVPIEGTVSARPEGRGSGDFQVEAELRLKQGSCGREGKVEPGA